MLSGNKGNTMARNLNKSFLEGGGVYVFICVKSFLRDFKLLQGVPVGRKEFSSDGRKFFHVCRTS